MGRRAGAVQEAVIHVLAAANKPLRAREIHSAAQQLAGTALSWNTVKDCLHKNARRLDSPIERVGMAVISIGKQGPCSDPGRALQLSALDRGEVRRDDGVRWGAISRLAL